MTIGVAGVHCAHPYKIISKIPNPSNWEMQFRLVYFFLNYPGYGDENTYLYRDRLTKEELSSAERLNSILLDMALPSSVEIGLAAKFKFGGVNSILPMVDFVGRPPIARIESICHALLDDYIGADAHYRIYDSGNSYHAYFDKPISDNLFRHYLSGLSRYAEVDQKWVAHSNRSRFGSVLRWTCRTGLKGVIREVRKDAVI